MPAATSLARFFQPRFSLRTLLVLMAVVGVALTIYRWPWKGTKLFQAGNTNIYWGELGRSDANIAMQDGKLRSDWEEPGTWIYSDTDINRFQQTTTYRRAWNFAHLKDGVEEVREAIGIEYPLLVRREYIDGDLRRLTLFNKGKAYHSEQRLNGKAHGAFDGSQSWYTRTKGNYDQGQKVGTWAAWYDVEGLNATNQETIEVEQSYSQGWLHGDWIWKTQDGRVLQSARFEQGNLAQWNGQPVNTALRELFQQCVFSDKTRADLLLPGEPLFETKEAAAHEFEFWARLHDDKSFEYAIIRPTGTDFRVAGWRLEDVHKYDRSTGRATGVELLEFCLLGAETLTVRYGQLCRAPICSRELLHWDRTNVSAVKFPADSPSEKAWLEKVTTELFGVVEAPQLCRNLFRETPIQIEFAPVPRIELGLLNERLERLEPNLPRPRSRRDLFGLLLHLHDWRCEQRGDTLVISQNAK